MHSLSIKPFKTLNYLIMALILFSLFLIPEFSFSGIGLRIEDLGSVYIGLLLLFLLVSGKLKALSFVKFYSAYLFYGLVVTLIAITINNLSASYFFFFLKEVQYFLYFLFFYYLVRTYKSFITIKGLFSFLASVTILWGLYQIVSSSLFGYYGIGAISETSSSQTGGLFFIITLFFLYSLYTSKSIRERIFNSTLLTVSVILTFFTISRTAILALVIAFVIWAVIVTVHKRVTPVKAFVFVYLLPVLLFCLYWLTQLEFVTKIFDRISRISQGASFRSAKWEFLLNGSSDLGLIIGNGKGFPQTLTGGFTLATDSQYIRLLLEVGWVGLLLWGISIAFIVIFAARNLKRNFALSIFIIMLMSGFLVMGVTHEVFLVTIQASVFWCLIGMFMAEIVNKNEKFDRN